MPYQERVHASPVFRLLVWALIAIPVAIAIIGAVVSEPIWPFLLSAIGTGIVLVLLDRWFMTLEVTVDREAVTARFGPFRTRLEPHRIEGVQAEPYRWTRYGGWGIRFGVGNRRAWSVPFLKHGVLVALNDGPSYFISSHSPERLRSAITQLTEARGGTRG